MRDRLIGKAIACVMAVVFPAAMLSAEPHAAMLYTTGTVWLNGTAAVRSSAVFAGDTIQTPSDAAVSLTSEGSTVMLGPSSSAVYQGDAVQLTSGSALVTTVKSMRTHVAKLHITPGTPGRASYRVARTPGKTLIAALHGAVVVSDGEKDRTVPEGASTTVSDPGTPPPQRPGAPGPGVGVWTAAGVAAGIGAVVISTLISLTTTPAPTPLSPP